MNKNNSSITGLILREGRIRSITIPSPLLIFDARSWARTWADKMATEATAAGIDGDYVTSISLARAGAELISWLRDPTQPTPSWPELAVRQTMQPLNVRTEDLSRYMDMVWEWSSPHQIDEPDPFTKVDFLLDIDNVILTGTRKNRVVLQHAGDIRAREVTRVELENQIAIAMIMCAPEWDEPTSDDEDMQNVAPIVYANSEADTTARLGNALAAAMPHMRVDSNTRMGEIIADLAIPDAGLLIEIKDWSDNDSARHAGDAVLAMRPAGWRGMLIDGREVEEHMDDVVERIVGLCVG